MDDIGTCADGLRRLLDEFFPRLRDLAVALVISERGATPKRDDYDSYSVSASFLQAEEIAAILDALATLGIYAQHFNDEVSFLAWAAAGGMLTLPRPNRIVYTSAVNGVGPGRRALVPAFCSLMRIPTVNSDAYSCAINRQKFHWNTLLSAFGLPVPDCWSIDPDRGWHRGISPPMGLKVVGKATYEGSSIGLRDETVGAFGQEIERRFRRVGNELRQPLTIQRFVAGDEFEVPVLQTPWGPIAPAAIRITRPDGTSIGNGILSFDDAWDDDYRFRVCEDHSLDTRLRETALAAIDALNFRGFSRVDFRVDAEGKPWIIDVSSTPHLTKTSSVFELFKTMGFSYEDLWALQMGCGARRHGLFSLDVAEKLQLGE